VQVIYTFLSDCGRFAAAVVAKIGEKEGILARENLSARHGSCVRILVEPTSKAERLCKVKANKGMLLLPAEHSAPGSLEECHGMIAMTMYCQLQG